MGVTNLLIMKTLSLPWPEFCWSLFELSHQAIHQNITTASQSGCSISSPEYKAWSRWLCIIASPNKIWCNRENEGVPVNILLLCDLFSRFLSKHGYWQFPTRQNCIFLQCERTKNIWLLLELLGPCSLKWQTHFHPEYMAVTYIYSRMPTSSILQQVSWKKHFKNMKTTKILMCAVTHYY